MTILIYIFFAVVVDLIIGDPRRFPHLVCGIGKIANFIEFFCRKKLGSTIFSGLAANLIIVAIVISLYLLIELLLNDYFPFCLHVFYIYVIYSSLSIKSLIEHADEVFLSLSNKDLATARTKVSYIVGRDTEKLNEEGVIKATVESVSENIVDGIISPLFYAFLFGPIGALLYRVINTLDSMFGYKNEKYLFFGRVSAHLDDIANYIPARVTGILITLSAFILNFSCKQSWEILKRDAKNTPSPNSGWSMSAVAGALQIQLGGSSSYFGKIVEKAPIGDPFKIIDDEDIKKSNQILLLTTTLFIFLGSIFYILLI